ncbi:hypothetical protein [Bacteroides acidifaciens]|uniref:hypothetical protein n=1 Tax=Bacteroides acidifaciens TaxID=85831 RepID=UPI00262EF937|nr:hypothetical protein [Bacteroides acidifaciens]
MYNDSFTILSDDLSEYLDSHDRSLLKEDMLQLAYKEYLIDLGYYTNQFILYVVKDYDWNNLVKKRNLREEEIMNSLNKACDEVLSYYRESTINKTLNPFE